MSLILDGTNGVSDIDGSATTPAIRGTDTNTGIFFPAADTIAFAEGGAESMRITSAGDVGIGTSTPVSQLHLVSASDSGLTIYKSAVGAGNVRVVSQGGGSALAFGSDQSTGTTERMRIDSSGNVGIGTSSSNEKLMVVGAGKFTGQATSLDQAGAFISYASNVAIIAGQASTGGTLAFYTNPNAGFQAERMRIDSSGNLLVGATAPPFSNANFADGSTYVNGNAFINNSSGTSQYNVRFDGYSDQLFVVWSNGNTQSNSIYYAYGGTAWVNSSDEALKDIIEPITNAVDKVSQLRSVIGKYKTEEEGARHPFLIAQDVQKVLPEAVYLNKSRVEGEPDTLGVGYTDVIPLLVSAIQEQQAIITDLKSRIEALEAK